MFNIHTNQTIRKLGCNSEIEIIVIYPFIFIFITNIYRTIKKVAIVDGCVYTRIILVFPIFYFCISLSKATTINSKTSV